MPKWSLRADTSSVVELVIIPQSPHLSVVIHSNPLDILINKHPVNSKQVGSRVRAFHDAFSPKEVVSTIDHIDRVAIGFDHLGTVRIYDRIHTRNWW